MDYIKEYKKWVENVDDAEKIILQSMDDDEIQDAFSKTLLSKELSGLIHSTTLLYFPST